MSYKLYYFPGACSMTVHIVLNEAGQDVELILAKDANGNKIADLSKVNPRAQVPVLMEDGRPLFEGAAQMIYLCDKHNLDLLPKSGWERAQALQWLMIGNASLHPAYSRTNFLKKNGGTEDQIRASRAGAQAIWDQVEAHLNDSKYLAGDQITLADILFTVIGHWADPGVYSYGPKTNALFKEIIARSAYQKALQAENVEYKDAA